ncbi:MAG: hypothetical protein J5640_04120 [Bacteroidales bacterium]|nr:hypothetical protein [Bacteroidales bacterium]
MKRLTLILLLVLSALQAGARVYVSTDKGSYVAGDRIWCSVFCEEGPAVAYLELVSAGEVAARTRIDIRSGRGGGSLRLPLTIPTGNYRLVAYTDPQKASEAAGSGPLIAVYNTLTTDRVKDGVEVVEDLGPASPAMQTGYGLSVETVPDGIRVDNLSGAPVSLSLSVHRDDSLEPVSRSSIAGFEPGAPGPAAWGERLTATAVGLDPSADGVTALLSVPGSPTDCYVAERSEDGSFSFDTENLFGTVDVVCQLDGLPEGAQCHLELQNPFSAPLVEGLPKLRICRSQSGDLVRRGAAMLTGLSSDTLAVSLPMRREHFFLTHECVSYVLDDYNRFPTMAEVFVEITPLVKMRMRKGKPRIYGLMRASVLDGIPWWGDVVVMVDGVPVPDHSLIMNYDPAIVKSIDVYPYRYRLGDKTFDGVINLVTFKGNMPGLLFDDNVRIYSFDGCSLPQEHRGQETLYWHPLIDLQAGGSLPVRVDGLQPGVRYTISAEGVTGAGRAVYFRKTFVR